MKANHLRLALGFQVLFLVYIIRLTTNLGLDWDALLWVLQS